MRQISNPVYSHDWFSHNIPNWTKWLKGFGGRENLSFLEIGCFEGMATRWLLDNILTGKHCSMTVVDTFAGSMEHQELDKRRMFERFMTNVGYDRRVKVFPIPSKAFLKNTSASFDFIYIDGSHKAIDVIADAILSWDVLRKNGILIFDDYKWKRYPKTSNFHPKPAIDSFMAIFDGEYRLIEKGYQVCLMKQQRSNYGKQTD